METEMPLFWPERLAKLNEGQCEHVKENEISTVYKAIDKTVAAMGDHVRFSVRTDRKTKIKYVWRLPDNPQLIINNI